MPSLLGPSRREGSTRADVNRLDASDRAAHDWYRFVLSFPPHLVRDYLGRFSVDRSATVLDPFCGTGTTLVECKKHGIPSVGIEAHPMSYFASARKLDWSPDPDEVARGATSIPTASRYSPKAT
ncbi:MAG: DNA methyltransferase [Chthoniobacterales bacterium]